MATEATPYIPRNPGDLITAEDWNDVQKKTRDDIAKQIQDAIQKIDTVPNADNAHKLENKTPDQLSDEILERARQELPTRTGYRRLFKRLKTGEEKVIKHKLEACPLVDIYQLDYFKVICSEDDEKSVAWVNFYLYHSSEKRLRFTDTSTNKKYEAEIEPKDGPPYRIPFLDMLGLYKVPYTETSSLGDLETEFWKAFFADPNDSFDDDQYCHSPWFDRCCGEKRAVGDLKQKGDWNDLWFKMQPRKTINYAPGATDPTPAPTQIQVAHFDFNNLGIKLVTDPVLPTPQGEKRPVSPSDELKVMVLLKV
jgi:hypothetical protein